MTVNVTLQVPSSVYKLAQKTAHATARPVERVLEDVILSASPFSENLAPELQTQLEKLAQLPEVDLWEIAQSNFSAARRRRYDQLLEKSSAGKITPAEREELKKLRLASEQLMLRKAHAYALLKWRGHVLPPLSKISLDCLPAMQ